MSRGCMSEAGFLTISVDDGHPSDLRAAELLERHGLAATFYVPAHNPEREVLAPAQLRQLARRFELGAHTYGHVPLAGLPAGELRHQVEDGKRWLEDLTGRPVAAFCYPRGKLDRAAVRAVADAGFLGARTSRWNRIDVPRHPMLWDVSTHAWSHSAWIQARHALLEGNWRGLWSFATRFRLLRDWSEHFLVAVRAARRCGGVAHLYLHSWEMDAADDWQRLDGLLARLAGAGLRSCTNGELFASHPIHRARGPV